MPIKSILSFAILLLPLILRAEDAMKVDWEAFVDTYYAYDFNTPPFNDRAYSTSAVRNDEFNVNLVYLGANFKEKDTYGRLALQAGTSVEANYSTEPINGLYSKPNMVKFIQEAYVGLELNENTEIEAGIFFSHIGLESFISKNNMTYTRSLVADLSPYYQAGVKLRHHFSEQFFVEAMVLNGWQIVTENNASKAIGTKIQYNFSDSSYLSYNTFFGKETQFRHFHDILFQTKLMDSWNLGLQADIGFQKKQLSSSYSTWTGFSLISQLILNNNNAFSQRIEMYSDPDQVIVQTNTPYAFQTWSGSLGWDRKIGERATWRNEFRYYHANNRVFPTATSHKKMNSMVVSSLSLSF